MWALNSSSFGSSSVSWHCWSTPNQDWFGIWRHILVSYFLFLAASSYYYFSLTTFSSCFPVFLSSYSGPLFNFDTLLMHDWEIEDFCLGVADFLNFFFEDFQGFNRLIYCKFSFVLTVPCFNDFYIARVKWFILIII